MTVRDFKGFSPDDLRMLYRAPKNPLRDLDDTSAIAQGIVNTTPSQPPSNLPGGGGAGGGTGGGGCPAVNQWTISRINGTRHAMRPVLVQQLKPVIDWLWHPIRRSFDMVTHVSIVKDVQCVEVRTFDGASQIVSKTHPVIQSFVDRYGTTILELLQNPEAEHHAVSCIEFDANETQIEWIKDLGTMDVVRITLERFGIYASGTDPLKTVCGHNKRSIDEGGGGPAE